MTKQAALAWAGGTRTIKANLAQISTSSGWKSNWENRQQMSQQQIDGEGWQRLSNSPLFAHKHRGHCTGYLSTVTAASRRSTRVRWGWKQGSRGSTEKAELEGNTFPQQPTLGLNSAPG